MKSNSKTPSFFKDLQTRPFELQVWFVVSAIAGIRTLKSVVQDIINRTNSTGLIIDVLILLVFCSLCFLIYKRKIRSIPLIIGIILLVLLIFSYVQFGGLLGATEYNIMGLGVIFVLAYSRKQLVFLMILYVLLIVAANLDLRYEGWLTQSFFKYNSTSLDTYLTTLLTLLLIILYFKNALVRESSRVMELRVKLGGQVETIRQQQKELKDQKQFLQKVNGRLEEEIKNHSNEIDRQNRAMKDYIWLSTESLQIPLTRIRKCVADLSDNGALEGKLKEQVDELTVVVKNLKSELKRHQRTDN